MKKFQSKSAENFSWGGVIDAPNREIWRALLQKAHGLPYFMQYRKPVFAIDCHAVGISRNGEGGDERSYKITNAYSFERGAWERAFPRH
jgi:uncharacterized protein YndB with AHSA1/START domain